MTSPKERINKTAHKLLKSCGLPIKDNYHKIEVLYVVKCVIKSMDEQHKKEKEAMINDFWQLTFIHHLTRKQHDELMKFCKEWLGEKQ